MYQDTEGRNIKEKHSIAALVKALRKDSVSSDGLHQINNDTVTEEYQSAYQQSLQDPEGFWGEVAQELEWTKPWDTVIDDSNPPFTKWFPGGEFSVCHNAVDRHVAAGRGEQTALIFDSPLTSTVRKFTYSQLLDQVSRLAGKLLELGVTKGSRVLIYMPVIPETVAAMLATNRIGAIHSVVFGGFSARELRMRIEHAQPTVIIGASCGLEPNKIVRYKDIINEALSASSHQPRQCIIYQRSDVLECSLDAGRDISWSDAMQAAPAPCVPLEANDPLYIMYTSGTTSEPKGIVRPCHHAVPLVWSMHAVYGLRKGVFWAASDLGWTAGHSYICYGPLLAGVTAVMYEGKPDRTPDAGQYFRLIEQHKINAIFAVPTAFRLLKHVDPRAEFADKYSQKSLKAIFLGGEHCDYETRNWMESVFTAPIINHWWQTESGSPMSCACFGYGVKAVPLNSAGYPVPGYDMRALREDGTECAAGEVGRLVVKLPLPPGFASTMWQADYRFQTTYFDTHPGFYDTQDAGWISSEHALYVTARADDVINVAGHRLSTAAIEDVVLRHPMIADAVVVGVPDDVKGVVPLCVYVARSEWNAENPVEKSITADLISMVRDHIGPVACFYQATSVPALPRTRTGKPLRGAIAKLARCELVKLPSTIENPGAFREVKIALQKVGFALNAPDPIL